MQFLFRPLGEKRRVRGGDDLFPRGPAAFVGGGFVPVGKAVFADRQLVPVRQGAAVLEPLAVHEGAVNAAEVFEDIFIVPAENPGVAAAHGLGGERNVRLRHAADDLAALLQEELSARTRTFDDG